MTRSLLLAGALVFIAPPSEADCPRVIEHVKVTSLRKGVSDFIRSWRTVNLPAKRRLATVKEAPSMARDAVALVKCDEPTMSGAELAEARSFEAKATLWADSAEKDIAAEETARASVVLPLCQAIWGAQNAQKVIESERSNPSGVVDLRVLHDAGDSLRYWREQVAALRPLYKKTRGHDLVKWQDEGVCVEDAATSPQ